MSNWPPPQPPPMYPAGTPSPLIGFPQQYGYAQVPMASSARPGVLTAVGVLSIIFGSVGLLVNIGSIFQSMMISTMSTNMPKPVLPMVQHSAPAGASEYVAPDGIPARQRQVIIDGLGQVRELSEARRQRVDALLADAGKKIFHFTADSLTPEHVAANVTSSMSMPSASGAEPDDVFVLGTGRLQVNDQTAVFFPTGSPSGIRSEGGSFTDSTGTHLAAVQIGAVVDRVQRLCNNALNATQSSALQMQLQMQGQKIISASPSVAGAVAQVQSAQALADGTVAITTDSNVVSIGPNGEVMPGITPASQMTPTMFQPFRISRRATTLMFLESILSFGAAAFLLVCGILTLKNSHVSRRIHLGYAIAKIILIAVGAYATYAVWSAIMQSPGVNNADAANMLASTTAIVFAAMGLLYPICLLIVFNLKGMREYFKAPIVGRIY